MRILSVFCLLTAAAWAQSISVVKGPVDDQVYQRGADGKVEIPIELSVSGADGKNVFLSIKRGPIPLAGFIAHDLGKVENGKVSTVVKGVPTGGPYRFEFRTSRLGAAMAARSDILVGDIWLLAGQSNMEGVGDLIDVEKPSDKVNSFDQLDHWVNAKEPLHELPGAVDRVHWRKNAAGQPEQLTGAALEKFRAERKKGAGLGLSFAIEYEKRTGIPVGLLPCAHGGTSMAQWSPELKSQGGDSLYGATLRRVGLVGGKVKGILWYQGESDANATASPVFPEKFQKLVEAFRQDLGQPDLPFYSVQIGRHVNGSNVSYWNLIQEDQRLSEKMIPNTVVFSAVDADLDDGIHVSTQDHKRLGRAMGGVAAGKLKKGPHPEQISVEGDTVRVRYSEVNGKLVSNGRIAGFTALDTRGQEVPLFYKASFDPKDGNSVLLHFQGKLPDGVLLSYGHGKDPYCNLRDEAGLGALVFGPLPIQ
ncbi:sialate O-acetylesterase [Bryobacter aggregatus]|uniref:sialate O-acetylesterase n=1 Tax=Bryobacter aggregatus TaxID=360054 RepID=UPI00068DA563|nr:sialate O-acetylesterase [Bryobacter aggregatus]